MAMEVQSITPIAAFDFVEGAAVSVSAPWPDLSPPQGFRWIHLDLTLPEIAPWVWAHLPEVAAQALLQSETRPRCERLQDGLILNLRGVNLNPQSEPEDMVSLRLWITERAIVSARLRKVWVVDAMRKSAEEGSGPGSIGRFLADLTYGLTMRIESVSLGLEEQTDALEEAVSQGDSLPSGELAALRQRVIKMRRFINPQREAIAALSGLENWIIAPEELALLRETNNRTRRTVEELDASRDRLSALHDYLEADRALALSRNSYVLSIVAAIFLPLGFLTGLFGVNVAGMPGTENPAAFAILAGVSLAGGIALYIIFKFARWL